MPHLKKDEAPGCHRHLPGLTFQCTNPPLSWGAAWSPWTLGFSSISCSLALGCPLPWVALPQSRQCGAHFTTPLPTGLGAAGSHRMIPHSEHGGKHGCPCHTQHLLVARQKKGRRGASLLEIGPGSTGSSSMVLCDTVLAGMCRCWCLSASSSSFDALLGWP